VQGRALVDRDRLATVRLAGGQAKLPADGVEIGLRLRPIDTRLEAPHQVQAGRGEARRRPPDFRAGSVAYYVSSGSVRNIRRCGPCKLRKPNAA